MLMRRIFSMILMAAALIWAPSPANAFSLFKKAPALASPSLLLEKLALNRPSAAYHKTHLFGKIRTNNVQSKSVIAAQLAALEESHVVQHAFVNTYGQAGYDILTNYAKFILDPEQEGTTHEMQPVAQFDGVLDPETLYQFIRVMYSAQRHGGGKSAWEAVLRDSVKDKRIMRYRDVQALHDGTPIGEEAEEETHDEEVKEVHEEEESEDAILKKDGEAAEEEGDGEWQEDEGFEEPEPEPAKPAAPKRRRQIFRDEE